MKKCFCKLQASVPIYSTTGGYANVEDSLQIKNCRKYAQHAIKCNFLYQSHTQGSFIPIFPLIFASVLFRIFFSCCIILSVTSSLEGSLSGAFWRCAVTWCDLVLLHFLLSGIPFHYTISDPSQTCSHEKNLNAPGWRVLFPSCVTKFQQVGNTKCSKRAG